MFEAGLLGLGGLFGGIFWWAMRRWAGQISPQARAGSVVIFLGLSGGIYTLNGAPAYNSAAPLDINQQLGLASRSDRLSALETYSALVAASISTKDEWLDAAKALGAGNRPVEAADALVRAANLATESPEKAALFGAAGETLIAAKRGEIDETARAAFISALEVDADSLGALYYLGRDARERNQMARAQAYWQRFLSAAPDGHPLIAEVQGNIALLGETPQSQTRIAPTLTPEMLAQFDGLDADARRSQIVLMLDRAETRLLDPQTGATAEDWRELARAYQKVALRSQAIQAYDRALELAPDNNAIALEHAQFLENAGAE